MKANTKPAAKSATKSQAKNTKTAAKTAAKTPAKKTLAKFTGKAITKTSKALAKKPAAKVVAKKPAIKWFDAQVCVKYGELHIQAKKRNPVGEKSYWAFDAMADDKFDTAMGQTPRDQNSMAGTGRNYCKCQIALVKKGTGKKATQEVKIKIDKTISTLTGINYGLPLNDATVAEYFAKL